MLVLLFYKSVSWYVIGNVFCVNFNNKRILVRWGVREVCFGIGEFFFFERVIRVVLMEGLC